MKQPSENSSDLHKLMPKMFIKSENKTSTIIIEEHVHFGDDKAIESCSSSEDKRADVQSTIPADYNDEDRLFHLNFIQSEARRTPQVAPKRFKNGTRKSLSFSNEEMREIERNNRILLQKILSRGPVYPSNQRVPSTANTDSSGRVSSAAVNRKKQQRQIDLDNQLLKKKIERISRRK